MKTQNLEKSGSSKILNRKLGLALKMMVLVMVTAVLGNTQDAGELVSLGKKNGVGARAIGMGEAFTAVADDYSSLYYNPAGMTQLLRTEIGLSLGWNMSQNNAYYNQGGPNQRTLESTRLNALTMILTDGGRWALGLGYYSPTSFDDPLGYKTEEGQYTYTAAGKMDHYRVGLAYKLNEEVSLGMAITTVGGSEQLEVQDGITERYLEEYAGFNVEPSLLIHLSDFVSLGASAVVVERLELLDTYQEKGFSPQESVYEINHPFQAKLGIAFQTGLTQISADWHGDFWSSYSYRGAGAAFATTDMGYPNKHTFNIGLEQHLAKHGPVFRLGYTLENEDQKRPQALQKTPYRVSAGLGLSASKRLGLDLAYQYAGSEKTQNSQSGGADDLFIVSDTFQVMAALRFRL